MSLCQSLIDLKKRTELQILEKSGIYTQCEWMIRPILRAAELGISDDPSVIICEPNLEVEDFVKLIRNGRKGATRIINCANYRGKCDKFLTDITKFWNGPEKLAVVCLQWVDSLGPAAQNTVAAIFDDVERGKKTKLIMIAKPNFAMKFDEGKIEPKLFYRLTGAHVEIPPLRERGREDIRLLVEFFRKMTLVETGRTRVFPERTIRLMGGFDWPLNLVGLELAVRSLVLNGAAGLVTEVEREELYDDSICKEVWLGKGELLIGDDYEPPKRFKSQRPGLQLTTV